MELTANGVRLHDEVSGQGPAVVLLHGNGANLHFFDALTALLEPRYIQALGLSRRTALYSARRGAYQLSEKAAGFSGPCGGFPA